jgi:hypothetical protein
MLGVQVGGVEINPLSGFRRAPKALKQREFPLPLPNKDNMTDEWHSFDLNLIQLLLPSSGVYELADEHGMTIYIGDSDNLRSCFESLLGGFGYLGIKQRAKMCRFEYREDFQRYIQFLRELCRDVFDRGPTYN